jgi:hypothetical protein
VTYATVDIGSRTIIIEKYGVFHRKKHLCGFDLVPLVDLQDFLEQGFPFPKRPKLEVYAEVGRR